MANALEWFIFAGVLTIIALLVSGAVIAANVFGNSQKLVADTANNVNTKLDELDPIIKTTANNLDTTAKNVDQQLTVSGPVFKYIRDGLCNSTVAKGILGDPPAGLCPEN